MRRYATATGAVLLFLAFSVGLRHVVPLDNYDWFQGAVFLSAWLGGLGPGLWAALLSSAAIDFYLTAPVGRFSFAWKSGLANLAVFWIVAFITSSLSARLRGANGALQRSQEELEKHLAERTRDVLEISAREHHRLGQDLHDGLCQTLAGARLMAESVREELADRNAETAKDVERLEHRLQEALVQAETVARGLYHVELETHGLGPALSELARKTTELYRLECVSASRGAWTILSKEAQVHLYRIAQEAVVNAVKHGQARRIRIRLTVTPRRGALSVTDDGCGLETAGVPRGMGLRLMQYRAKTLGGDVSLRPRRHRGAHLSCRFGISS